LLPARQQLSESILFLSKETDRNIQGRNIRGNAAMESIARFSAPSSRLPTGQNVREQEFVVQLVDIAVLRSKKEINQASSKKFSQRSVVPKFSFLLDFLNFRPYNAAASHSELYGYPF
jgi:predicted secreted protein